MYATVSAIAQDPYIAARTRACIADQVVANNNSSLSMLRPQLDVGVMMWLLAAQPGWSAAWESAQATARAEDAPPLGNDVTVITDAMILAAVQAVHP